MKRRCGESLVGKRILLVKEQGFGDQIQCLRFAQNLVGLGAEVGVWLHPALAPLAASVAGVHVAVTDAPTDAYDFWVFLMSLPVHFNAGFDNLPGVMPYVQVVTLDDFLPSLVPDLHVRLIKVDVEGMERAVLSGACQMIARDRPFLYVENDRIDQSEALICHMREMGYRLYWHCPLLFNGNNFFANADNIYQGITAINMLGVPNEVAFDVTSMTEVGAANVHILMRE